MKCCSGSRRTSFCALAFGDAGRDAGIFLFLFGDLVFILGFFVNDQEAGELDGRTGSAQQVFVLRWICR